MKRKPLILVNLLVMLVLLTPGNIQPAMAQAESPPFDAMSPAVPGRADVADALRSSPLMFIENIGQFSDGARFQAQGGHGMIWLAEEAIWLTVFEQELRGAEEQQNGRNLSAAPGRRHTSVPHPEKGIHLKLTFPGAVP